MFTPIFGVMQHLDLSDEEAAALIKELAEITGNDRYPFSPRVRMWRQIRGKLPNAPPEPPPVRPPRYHTIEKGRTVSTPAVNYC
jgi:hypothetical protein